MKRLKIAEKILFILCLLTCAWGMNAYWDEMKLWTLTIAIISGPTVFWSVCIGVQEYQKKNIINEGYFLYVLCYALLTAAFLFSAQDLKISNLWLIWLISLTGFWWLPISINVFEKFFLGEHATKDG